VRSQRRLGNLGSARSSISPESRRENKPNLKGGQSLSQSRGFRAFELSFLPIPDLDHFNIDIRNFVKSTAVTNRTETILVDISQTIIAAVTFICCKPAVVCAAEARALFSSLVAVKLRSLYLGFDKQIGCGILIFGSCLWRAVASNYDACSAWNTSFIVHRG